LVHLFAALAEKERAIIATRTRDALQRAKARGVKLGGPKLAEARKAAVGRRNVANADHHAANVLQSSVRYSVRAPRCIRLRTL
jgi:DNA invertase Pin-like site-specific DNA recombinase